MNIFTKAIVSNSDMIKNYKTCREKAGVFGKIFIMKNNQPDAVLFSQQEYERISGIIEYLESLDDSEVRNIMKTLPKAGSRDKHSIIEMRDDLRKINGSHFTDGSVQGKGSSEESSEGTVGISRTELKELI